MFQSPKKEIFIIGCVPPPIGGLSIHVERLLNVLKAENIRYSFRDYLNESNLLKTVMEVRKYKIIHLHTANVYLRLVFAIICKFTNKKLILTLHGNLGRHSNWKNRLDSLSIKLSHIPVLINENSYKLAIELNKRSKLISAFIPPQNINEQFDVELIKWKNKYSKIFCTYAFRNHSDHLGREIYGVKGLVKIFRNFKNYGLIISDPSGDYRKYFLSQKSGFPKNIYLINQPHSFVDIINISDAFIRATVTDGDSLSLNEALYLKKIVFTSDCVSRPDGCVLYECGNFDDLKSKIDEFDWEISHSYFTVRDGSKDLIKIYYENQL